MYGAEPSVEDAVPVLVRLARLLERTDSGLSLAQFRILELVARGTERSTQIASRLATSKPAITMAVEDLVGSGLLTRGSHHGDRRVIVLALTDDGRAALARAQRAYGERLEPLLEGISDPAALLTQLAELDQVMDERWAARRAAKPGAKHGAKHGRESADSEVPPTR